MAARAYKFCHVSVYIRRRHAPRLRHRSTMASNGDEGRPFTDDSNDDAVRQPLLPCDTEPSLDSAPPLGQGHVTEVAANTAGVRARTSSATGPKGSVALQVSPLSSSHRLRSSSTVSVDRDATASDPTPRRDLPLVLTLSTLVVAFGVADRIAYKVRRRGRGATPRCSRHLPCLMCWCPWLWRLPPGHACAT